MKHNFREINSWKDSFELVKSVYVFCASLHEDERFGLKSQIQRSAVSIPSNIEEGSGRTSDREFLHFLNIAISSTYELETQLSLRADLFNLNADDLISKLQSIQRQIGGLKKKIELN